MPDFFIPKSETELTENIHILNFALETPQQIDELVLNISSFPGKAYLVGGSVRDSILSAKTGIDYEMKDFDLEVYGITPLDLKEKLSKIYGKVEEVGESFGVFKVKIEGISEAIDIAIPRTDKVSDDNTKGRGIVSYTDPYLDIVKSVKRRDITINSILYDPINKQVIDPFGGWYDLMNGVIKVTDPETFTEDPLRVLRVAQFASRFGFKISTETFIISQKLCENGGLNSLVMERVRDEFDKLLVKGFEPSIGLRFLKEIGYLDILLPEISRLSIVPQEPEYHPEGDVFIHTMQVIDSMADLIRIKNKIIPLSFRLKRALMLGALFHDLGKEPKTTVDQTGRIRSHGHEDAGVPIASDILDRVYKTKNQVAPMDYESLILFLVSDHMKPLLIYKEFLEGKDATKALRRFVNRCLENDTTIEQILMIVEADKLGRNSSNILKPLNPDSKPDLIKAIIWFKEVTKEISQEFNKKNKSILNIKKFLALDFCRELRPGSWIGVINRCVLLDSVDSTKSFTEDEALNRAAQYFSLIFNDTNPQELVNDNKFWLKYKINDPREILKLSVN